VTGPAAAVVLIVAALLLAACGLSFSHTASLRATPKCADGLPALVLQALTCPNGYCGFSCAPGRWELVRCP